ncbi:hypothetical protein RhiirA5_431874 [Rhizophagus irregularis]|uniref:Uncharacterized protein n=1 Tax=Rhizophagus irregularis TaxID=588596 RepID=A0A2N0NU90_9GLOM|nr:hypothetical protein RhiirA5_431874 [Rhizophagus irregularis]
MQNSIISTTIEISKNVEIGRLIGRKGYYKYRDENISPWEWINKAIFQIDKLLEDIEIRNRKKI